MANKNTEASSSQLQDQPPPPPQQQQNSQEQEQEPHHHHSGSTDSRGSRGGNTVFKSGPLYISARALGWTQWKKRWFILTRTSLVFFRSDPNAVQQKGSEVNLTLGGIDLNNSGSVVVKADKKLLTVLFPDGRDGRAFTLKADTMEDLNEWKAALEDALTQAPNASQAMGQNGIFTNDHVDDPPPPSAADENKVDETPTTTSTLSVLGRPVLLALEDVDGSPSFLEKALRYVEDHGSKIEGILRQAADVDDVERRIREYEQGKNEFTPTEDAHVIADCFKYFLRELPSSPVPASCCKALLEACRAKGNRVNAMREAICASFPEPNLRLLQRILIMMQVVASNKNVNRMNTNAVAACMAPLLLRPLLDGDCEIENDFDVGGDGSMQLLQAAAAANHAQAIVITLLEEYDKIFGDENTMIPYYSGSDESGSGTYEGTDDEEYDDDDDEDEYDEYTDDEEEDFENESEGSYSESAASADDLDDHIISSESKASKEESKEPKVTKKTLSGSKRCSLPRHEDKEKDENILVKGVDSKEVKDVEDKNLSSSDVASTDIKKLSASPSTSGRSKRRKNRTSEMRNLSMKSTDFSAEVVEHDSDIERLESTKKDMQNRVTEKVINNEVLQTSMDKRKKALYARRQALEKDVGRLQEELQKEKDKKLALEIGLNMSKGNQNIPDTIDEKLKKDLKDVAEAEADIANLEHKVDDLEKRLGSSSSKDSRKTQDHNEVEKQRGSSKPKRSNIKGEGNTTTTSALSKLTMRLNFLKERRSQIANELSNMDKETTKGQSNPSSGENRSSQETENKESDNKSSQSTHVVDKGKSENGGDKGGGSHPNTTTTTTTKTSSR